MPLFLRPEALSRWESAEDPGSVLKALVSVCAMAIFRPVDFFRTLAAGRGDFRKRIIRAVLFAVVLGYFKFFCDAAHIYALGLAARKGVLPASLLLQVDAIKDAFFTSLLVFARPLVVFMLTLGVVMLSMKLVLGIRRSLVAAFLVVCYVSAAQVFCVIPVVGGIFSSVWSIALLTIGIRELYRLGIWQAAFAAVFMPLVVLIFLMLAMGPSLNQAVVTFYPEAQAQMIHMNDLSAYVTTRSALQAAGDYKKELGFYPATFEALKKYLPGSTLETFENERTASGYVYQYARPDDGHFTLKAVPREKMVTGNFVFFGDQSGQLRLDGPGGREVKDIKDFEDLCDRLS